MPPLSHILAPVKSDALAIFAAKLDRYRRSPVGGCHIGGKFYAGGQFIGDLSIDAEPETVEVKPVVASIFGFTYEVEKLPVPAEIGVAGFLMHKRETRNTYAVLLDNHGELGCDCPDYVMRKQGSGAMCKHGAKLVEMGLMPLPRSMPLPPFGKRC